MQASVWIESRKVADLVSELPPGARLNERPYLVGAQIERLGFEGFGFYRQGGSMIVSADYQAYAAVDRLVNCVRGPAEIWLAERNSLPKLIAPAPTPVPGALDRVNPGAKRLRATAVLCLLNNQAAEAASLVEHYLMRNTFDWFDSRERVLAFDVALQDRFPDYRWARRDNGPDRPED
ncbi:hypothetical protein ACW2Q0_17150 [Nocardia sp. R16R-3T]